MTTSNGSGPAQRSMPLTSIRPRADCASISPLPTCRTFSRRPHGLCTLWILGAVPVPLPCAWHGLAFMSRCWIRPYRCWIAPRMLLEWSHAATAERGVRIISDYLPRRVFRNDEYERIFELERNLGKRPESGAVARYTHFLAHRAGPAMKDVT